MVGILDHATFSEHQGAAQADLLELPRPVAVDDRPASSSARSSRSSRTATTSTPSSTSRKSSRAISRSRPRRSGHSSAGRSMTVNEARARLNLPRMDDPERRRSTTPAEHDARMSSAARGTRLAAARPWNRPRWRPCSDCWARQHARLDRRASRPIARTRFDLAAVESRAGR